MGIQPNFTADAARAPAPISENATFLMVAGRGELSQSGFTNRPTVQRLESLLHPDVREQLTRWHDATMCDLEARGPEQQLNTRSPDRSNQHAISLRTPKARRPAEPQELRVNDDGTRLLQDLSAKALLP